MQDDPTEATEPTAPDPEPEPEGETDLDDGEAGYGSGEFHTVVQKQVAAAVLDILATAKMDWALVEPFLEAARDICRADFEATGQMRVHGVIATDDARGEAEEAYLSVSVADQDDGGEWLSETWWLSDAMLASGDPAEVREAVLAIERSLAKVNDWLAAQEAEPAPTADERGPDEAG